MAKNTFRQLLRPASWRGVPFEVAGEDSEFGRNVAVHEFVQRDKPYVEDLGRKARKFKLDAWLCAGPQNNFNPWPGRDALIAAVEQGGIGTLVHPFYGSLRGHVLHIAVKQTSTQGGGMIGLTLDFVEGGELEFKTTAVPDTRGRVSDSTQAVYSSAATEFSQNFNTAKAPSFVTKDAADLIKQLNSVVAKQPRADGVAAQVSVSSLQNA